MAKKAFILIGVAEGRSREVASNFRQVEGVKSVDIVTGPYDLIAIVEGENLNDIGKLVTNPIYGVSRKVTCLVLGTEDEG